MQGPLKRIKKLKEKHTLSLQKQTFFLAHRQWGGGGRGGGVPGATFATQRQKFHTDDVKWIRL